MRKNRMMRLASALLILTMVTTCAISGTFAKYVTSDTGTDSARVAKFGVVIDVAVEEAGKNDAFVAEYATDDTTVDTTVIANSVVGSEDVLAPGTKGTLLERATITGTPEVAVNVKKEATLTLTGWEADGDYYCPLKITVGSTEFNGMDYASETDPVAAFIAAVEGALESDVDYGPNQDLTANQTVTWEWAFEGGVGQTDELDTKLGDAATAATIAFTYTVTVTQID